MKKSILFIIPSLAGGGAEKVLLTLLNELDLSLFDPTVVVFSPRNDYPGKLRGGVELVFLEKRRPLDVFKVVFRLGRLIRERRPHLVCGFLYYANLIALAAKVVSLTRTPVVLTEHNHLAITIRHSRLQWAKKLLVKLLYPLAAKVVCVSSGIMSNLEEEYGLRDGKCTVIYNPFQIDEIGRLGQAELTDSFQFPPCQTVVSCGRLTTQKNYPLLLRSLKLLAGQVELKLLILGDGELRGELERLAEALGVKEQVIFLGFRSNPFAFIGKSSVFVLSSHWEGFGNVLVEAMACGTPVISTDCPSGPNEIISSELDGMLVPVEDEKALADSILRVLKDPEFSERLRQNGLKRCRDFDVAIITRKYEELFLQCC